jgi:hypothetical protein
MLEYRKFADFQNFTDLQEFTDFSEVPNSLNRWAASPIPE